MDSNQSSGDWHREDILAIIRKKKKSLAALSREHGLSSSTLYNTLSKHWPRGEKIIAHTIGLPPEEIWPSRYNSNKSESVNEDMLIIIKSIRLFIKF